MKTKHTLLGIEGELERRPYIAPGRHGIVTFAKQKFKASRKFHEDGTRKTIIVSVRFDDDFKNGHNTFAITGEIWNPKHPGDSETAGCIHDEIRKHFPELRHLIKWHLCSTDGPMHYPGNVTYLAGDRDHWGLLKGEPHPGPQHQETVLYVGNSPVPQKLKRAFWRWAQARLDFMDKALKTNPDYYDFEPVAVEYATSGSSSSSSYNFGPKFTHKGFDCKWHECPFDTEVEAKAWADVFNQEVKTPDYIRIDSVPTLFGEGKARELKGARSNACWPEITDEQLCLPKEELEKLLMDRLPSLIEEFKADMLACGFLWSVEDESPAPEA